MKDIFAVIKITRVRRAVQVTGKLQYLPALPEEIEADGITYRTGVTFWPLDRFEWRRYEVCGLPGMVRELGKIGTSSHYLYLALIPEATANAVRRLVDDVKVWTLREFLAGFGDFSPGLKAAWPASWYRRDEAGDLDFEQPVVAMAPASTTGLAAAGAGASEAGEWDTASTLEHAEAFVAQFGEPQ